jgi:hypothetical protein
MDGVSRTRTLTLLIASRIGSFPAEVKALDFYSSGVQNGVLHQVSTGTMIPWQGFDFFESQEQDLGVMIACVVGIVTEQRHYMTLGRPRARVGS